VLFRDGVYFDRPDGSTRFRWIKMLRPSRIEACRDTPVGVRVLLGGRIEPARALVGACGKE
jgi:hypothetical protein